MDLPTVRQQVLTQLDRLHVEISQLEQTLEQKRQLYQQQVGALKLLQELMTAPAEQEETETVVG